MIRKDATTLDKELETFWAAPRALSMTSGAIDHPCALPVGPNLDLDRAPTASPAFSRAEPFRRERRRAAVVPSPRRDTTVRVTLKRGLIGDKTRFSSIRQTITNARLHLYRAPCASPRPPPPTPPHHAPPPPHLRGSRRAPDPRRSVSVSGGKRERGAKKHKIRISKNPPPIVVLYTSALWLFTFQIFLGKKKKVSGEKEKQAPLSPLPLGTGHSHRRRKWRG